MTPRPEDAVAAEVGEAASARAPRWHLEDVARAIVRGWAVGAGGAPVEIDLRVEGIPVPHVLRRFDRPDVREAVEGTGDGLHGFALELDASAWHLAREPGTLAPELRLDGLRVPVPALTGAALDAWWPTVAARPASDADELALLRFLAHVAAAGGPARLAPDVATPVLHEAARRGLAGALGEFDVDHLIARAQRQRRRLERFEGLTVVGWAADPELEPQAFRVESNGQLVEARVEREERRDVQEALGAAESRLGFRIELPPAIWAYADAAGACAIDVLVQGRALEWAPLVVDRGVVRAAVDAAMPADGAAPSPGAAAPGELRRLEAHAAGLAARGLWNASDAAALDALLRTLDPQGRRTDDAHADGGSPAPSEAPPAAPLRAALDAWQDLLLAGWAVDEAAGGEVYRLLCNGAELPCTVTRTNRGDVREALGLPQISEFVGFEIPLPPRMWRLADADGACELVLLVNDRPLPIAPVRIDAAVLEAATLRRFGAAPERALRRADPAAVRERVLAWLLAEHLAESGAAARFGPEAVAALARGQGWLEQARRHGLHGEEGAPDERAALQQRRRVWRLQRRFNALLGRPAGTPRAALETILADVDATGAVRTELLLSLVPPLCDDPDAMARIERDLPLDVQALRAASGDNWQRSLYLVGLARAGRFGDACAVLERIVDAPGQGWLNTECVAFAVRQALLDPDAPDAAGPVDDDDDDDAGGRPRLQFIYLFLALVEALPGGWWSRRHDLRLVQAMAGIVAAQGVGEGGRADRLRDAALRHYGLSPSFWAHLESLGAASGSALARGREDFACLRANFSPDARAARDPGAWRELAERLRLQVRLGRHGAAQALRELMLRDLMHARAAGGAEDLSWPFAWEAAGTRDVWRAVEFPLPRAGAAPAAGHLWPTTDEPPAAGSASPAENRLDLRSPAERVAALADAAVLVVCVVRNERAMLPHFVAHYRRLGARHFVFVDNGSDDGTAEWLLDQPDVVLYAADTDYRDSHFGVAWQQAVLAAHGTGRWAIVADADELLLYPGCETEPLAALVGRLDAAGHDAACVLMLDMYPAGPLRDTDFARTGPEGASRFDREPLLRWRLGAGLYSNAPTWLSALRHRLIPHSPPNAFTAQKIALLRYAPWVRLSEGLHYAANLSPAPAPLYFGHYKYHADFREKVLREIERKQHYDGASEYAHYLAMVAEPDATLFAPELSVELRGSASLPVVDAEPGAERG